MSPTPTPTSDPLAGLEARLRALLAGPQFAMAQAEKEAMLLPALLDLGAFHRTACPAYARLHALLAGAEAPRRLADLPAVHAALFKRHALASIAPDQAVATLTSSGTGGEGASRILADARTADLQARALAAVMRHVWGAERLPMLILDTAAVLKDPRAFSARGAGVLGMMRLGRAHAFALDAELRPDRAAIAAFLERHGGAPFALFGFTFLAWHHFLEPLRDAGLDLRHGRLVHGGGWKALAARAVGPEAFRAGFRDAMGLARIHNYYGMVEQMGTVFLEGDDGRLYPPAFADVVVRDPITWAEAPPGVAGPLTVYSLLPFSYPGHVVQTEDVGIIDHVAAPGDGRLAGKGFRVLGRLPRAVLRGCSDVVAATAAGQGEEGRR